MNIRHGRRFTPGVRSVLAFLALMPLLGGGWLAFDAFGDADARVEAAASIADASATLTTLAELESELSSESYWANAISSVASFGIPPETVTSLLGVDMASQYDAAQTIVDGLVRDVGVPAVKVAVEAARSQVDASVPGDDIDLIYRSVTSEIDARIAEEVVALRRLVAEVPNSEPVSNAVETLERALALREDMSAMVSGFFASRYPSQSATADPAVALTEAAVLYEHTVTELHDLVPPETAIAAEWERLLGNPDVLGARAQVAHATGGHALDAGEATMAEPLGAVGVDLDREAAAFLGFLGAVRSHVVFVDAAATELGAAAGDLGAGAATARRAVALTTLMVLAASLVAVVVATRWIVRPLRHMAQVIDALLDGGSTVSVDEAGPLEVRLAARAINEATSHLDLAEQQARALAAGELTNPILERDTSGALGASLQAAVSTLAASLAEREEFRQRLAHESAHDGLTGLPNRSSAMAGLTRSLARVRRSDTDLAVLLIDIHGFKGVNDAHGHEAGDRVLRAVSRRVSSAVREGDQVARLGGDEFLVVAEPVRDVDEAVALAERLRDAIEVPVELSDATVLPRVSIGVAIAGTSDLGAEELLRDADLAVFRAKQPNAARIQVCDVALREALAHRLDLETQVRAAIRDGQLVCHYQPIFDATGALCSLEALVRWDRPDIGLVGPDEFIPVAERSDLILELDRWVLGHVVAQLADWASNPMLAATPVAVNLSARHLGEVELASHILELLAAAGVQPERLQVEITESALLDDIESAVRLLTDLRAAGVRVAIDDFGTGYTSLTHLRELPVDVLKIDRSFTANLDRSRDRSLVKLIIETGHLLGLSVTAEGVETDAQARRLIKFGSDHLQGFLYSRPLPPGKLLIDSCSQSASPARQPPLAQTSR